MWGIIPLVFLLIQLVVSDISKINRITVYEKSGFTGESRDFNISSCIPTLEFMWDREISGVNSHDNCVQLYEDRNCTGKYLTLRPGSPGHDGLSYFSFDNKARSIGPCFELCHPERIQGQTEIDTIVNLYNNPQRDYESPAETISLKFSECVDISNSSALMQTFRAKIPSSTCVEMHKNGDCTGEVTTLSMGPHTKQGGTNYYLNREKHNSVSFCGYNCNHSYANKDEVDVEEVEDVHAVLIFRSVDFDGERFSLKIPETKCLNLPANWSGELAPQSAITFGKCIELYAVSACDPQFLIEVVVEDTPFLIGRPSSARFCQPDSSSSKSGFNYLWIVVTLLLLLILASGLFVYKRKGGNVYNIFSREQSTPNPPVSYANGFRNGGAQRPVDNMHHRLIEVDT